MPLVCHFVAEVKNQVVESKEALLQRTDEKTMIAKEVMATASSGYWKCDPIKYQAGVNYAEFKELLQVHKHLCIY